MSYRGGYGSQWQGPSNPNMAPLPSRPPRGGIGSAGSGYVDHGASASAASPEAEVATTLFVGSISAGISDSWLTQLLEACGHLRSLKRASKAFAFAEYADPDSVLRAISVLNGRELPSMGADASAPPKKLLVKADEKTKRFLEQYKQSQRMHTDDTMGDDHAMASVASLVHHMSDPNAAVELDPTKPGYSVPDHLKDLPPEELPEENRGTVLSEIEHFRQAAAARDAESRRREAELVKQRASDRARRAEAPSNATSHHRPDSEGPQSYRRPVEFHASSRDSEPDVRHEPEEQDEIDWQRKQESMAARKKSIAAEAERNYIAEERKRLARWDREVERERADRDRSERDAVALLRKWEDWRDETATRRELFFTDRKRWRQFRASTRKREQEADQQDRLAEADEVVRAKEESERFLAQQAADMIKLTEQQRASGVLVPAEGGSLAPIKLTFSTNKTAPDGQTNGSTGPTGGTSAVKGAPAVSVLGEADEDERKKGAHRIKQISLADETSSEQEMRAKRQAIADTLPDDPTLLFQQTPKWTSLTSTLIDGKYRDWADGEIEESLGEKVEELVTVVVDCLHAHKAAQDLIELVEPVLDDEAEAFIAKLWRMLLIDSLCAAENQ